MRKVMLLIASLMLVASGAFAGTIFGSVVFSAPATDTAFVIVFHDFVSLYDTMLFYSEAYSPDYTFTISDAGIIDSYDFNALAIIPSRVPPNPGDPAGQYPGNPFQLTGGSITGIDIPVDTIGTIFGTVREYGGYPDSLMLGLYNYYPFLLGLPPTLAWSYRLADTTYTIEDIPAGAYSIRAWIDLNGNGYFDSTGAYNEPFAWHNNEMGGIVAIGGGCTAPVDFDLPWTEIDETNPLPKRVGVHCFPNPFNSAATIVLVGSGETYSAAVFDLSGRRVAQLFEGVAIGGITAFKWQPAEDIASGNYLIRVHSANASAERRISYLK